MQAQRIQKINYTVLPRVSSKLKLNGSDNTLHKNGLDRSGSRQKAGLQHVPSNERSIKIHYVNYRLLNSNSMMGQREKSLARLVPKSRTRPEEKRQGKWARNPGLPQIKKLIDEYF